MTPQEFAQAWADRTIASISKFTKKVNAVQSSPTAAAAAKVSYWQQRVSSQEAADKFVSGLNAVSLEEWRRLTADKGAKNISSGVTAAKSKMERVGAIAIQVGQSIKNAVKDMPKGDEGAALERVRVAMQTAKSGWAGRKV